MEGGAVHVFNPEQGERLDALRGVVHEKLGRCLIRLQLYEVLMKEFVAHARAEGSADSIAETQAYAVESVAKQTLGQAVGAFVGTVFDEPACDADGFPLTSEKIGGEVWVSSGFTMTFSDDGLGRVRAGMDDLVALRNELVHGFVLRHDLQSEAGCVAAATALEVSYEVIDRQYQQLRDWYKGMLDLQQAFFGMLTNPDYQGHFFPDLPTDGAGVEQRASTIVELLRHAEGELALDGWTPLDDAVAYIGRIAPDHTPGRYGRSTWRQVLHESHPIFTVKRETGDSKRRGRTWYQSSTSPGERAEGFGR